VVSVEERLQHITLLSPLLALDRKETVPERALIVLGFPEDFDIGHKDTVKMVWVSENKNIVDCRESHPVDVSALRRRPLYKREWIASELNSVF
jgi:hypothetical protein